MKVALRFLLLGIVVVGCVDQGAHHQGRSQAPDGAEADAESEAEDEADDDDYKRPTPETPQRRSEDSQLDSTDLLPPTDLPQHPGIPGAALVFDYPGVMSRSKDDAVVLRLLVQDADIAAAKKVQVRGNIRNLSNSQEVVPFERETAIGPDGIVDLTIHNLQPDTVYRIEGLALTDRSDGRSAGQTITTKEFFYGVTARDSELAKARRSVALRAVSEAYDWQHRRQDISKGYTRGAWCDLFYTWVVKEDFEINFPNAYSPMWLSKHDAKLSGSEIKTAAESEGVHGDVARYESLFARHTFMILAYDRATAKVWTVEGNFNSKVMHYQREVEDGWMFGHLKASMLK